MTVRLIIARPRSGVVGETRRVVHLFPYPDAPPEQLMAYCGATFGPGTLDQLDGIRGMPCELCLARQPGRAELP
ncbi:hypothetical protein ABZ863_11665 [Saccharomonospora sp. NPDC046836]|uniref:hypothetical protein n=1 Tax=Saccharomonospora sp. NPDC046836 TaxID=3156921 RepID=UPI0033FC8D91